MVHLTLEEGDNATEIRNVVLAGFELAKESNALIDAVPQDTLFCPQSTFEPSSSATVSKLTSVSPTTSPVKTPATSLPSEVSTLVPSAMPTSSPVVAPSTNSPSKLPSFAPSDTPTKKQTMAPSISPSAMPMILVSPTTGPIKAPTYSPTPMLTPSPVAMPTTILPSKPPTSIPSGTPTKKPGLPSEPLTIPPTLVAQTPFPSDAPSSLLRTMEIQIEYDLKQNNCDDFNANNIMKEGLVVATTTTTIGILNETYPRTEENGVRRKTKEQTQHRGLAHIRSPTASASTAGNISQQRNLAYYSSGYPVTITRVLDIYSGCPIGQKCVLIISSIPVVLEPGDDPDEVKGVIKGGMQRSVTDGSFFAAIPAGTV